MEQKGMGLNLEKRNVGQGVERKSEAVVLLEIGGLRRNGVVVGKGASAMVETAVSES